MADKTSFKQLDLFKLSGVSVTSTELGHGSYATVLELEYMRLKCAGKKIHDVLLTQGTSSYTIKRFEEECRLLSQVRHPNIVQFLGVYVQNSETVPILVLEFLPTNLTACIEKYGALPKEISYSILQDVALGLCYLHGQTPPIIHRDISSNNVLLTANMTAKISDLGVARILNLTPLQVSHMTQTPGTPAFMPPEVMEANRGQEERQILEESLKNEVSQLTSKNTELRARAAEATAENGALKFTTLRLEEQISMKEARINRHMEQVKIKEELLQKKDATIATVREQLKKTREYMATKKHVQSYLFLFCTLFHLSSLSHFLL
jgi:serine/threonine protein kinase